MVGASNEFGIQFDFPHTLEGAVAAAANWETFLNSVAYLVTSQRQQIEVDAAPVYARLEDTNSSWPSLALSQGIDPTTGQAVNRVTGQPIQGGVPIGDTYPQYGAYKVWWVTYHAQNPQLIDEIAITWIVPQVSGIKVLSDMSGVSLIWRAYTDIIGWDYTGNDYVVYGGSEDSLVPQLSVSNPGYGALADLTGHSGWCVPADASQEALPGTYLTQS
jgi:hypothetical protein